LQTECCHNNFVVWIRWRRDAKVRKLFYSAHRKDIS
jgi:hypothetical protein